MTILCGKYEDINLNFDDAGAPPALVVRGTHALCVAV